jgi:quercetin dioxygenase-like cupin family protein
MQLKGVIAIAVATGACGGAAGVALAGHPRVDPATVPTGFLTAHHAINNIPVSAIHRAVRGRKTDVFIQHARLNANQPTPYHTHPGPAFVNVVSGSLSYQSSRGGRCRTKIYPAGTGFVDPGYGHVHRAIAGPQGADFYVVYLLPRRTGAHLIERPAPRGCPA